MAKIPWQLIDELLSRADIVEVAREYLDLKRDGANWKALCPFHDDKDPSFKVSSIKGIYKCFGCNAGGNVINLVQRLEGISYWEAAEQLCERYGIRYERKALSAEEKRVLEKKDRAYKLLRKVCDIYRANLFGEDDDGKKMMAYIKGRGLSEHTIKDFKLGAATTRWDQLVKTFEKRLKDLDLMEELGLITRKKDGSGYVDTFRNKVVFPILDHRERIIGFGYRSMDDSGAKYINTRESMVFKKDRELYGLWLSRDYIRKSNSAIVMEGYFDVLGAWEHGVRNVVATMGTAFSARHLDMVKRFTQNIVFCFDGDEAGEKASLSAVQRCLPKSFNLQVMRLPDGLDPDDYLKKHDKDEFHKLAFTSPSGLRFVIESIVSRHDISKAEQKVEALNKIIDYVIQVNDPVLRSEYQRLIADRLQLKQADLVSRLNLALQRRQYFTTQDIEKQYIPHRELITWLLYIIHHNAEAAKQVYEVLVPEDFEFDELITIAKVIYDMIESGIELSPKKLYAAYQQEGVMEDFQELVEKKYRYFSASQQDHILHTTGCVQAIQRKLLGNELENKKKQLLEALRNNAVEDASKISESIQELAERLEELFCDPCDKVEKNIH